jgi:5-formyltetrahydrofolate cyclo-ligase
LTLKPWPLDKQALRRLAAAARTAAAEADPEAGSRLAAHAAGIGGPPAGGVVSGYWPIRSEIDPRPLMRDFGQAGATLCLPRTPRRPELGPLRFHRWAPGASLVAGPFGLLEPDADEPALAPDILLVPLLAFDRSGARLGYGQGHYDRTLRTLRAAKPILAVGLAFAAQEMAELPQNPNDEPLDVILTERGLIQTC